MAFYHTIARVKWLLALSAAIALVGSQASAMIAQDEATGAGPALPGVDLQTQEVEPGIYRILSDGVRELTRPIEVAHYSRRGSPGEVIRENALATGGIATAADGVWLGRSDAIVRLGEQVPALTRKGTPGWWEAAYEVSPDGRIYRGEGRKVFDGEIWRKVEPQLRGFKKGTGGGLQYTAAGTLWTKGSNGKRNEERREVIARRGAKGWALVKTPPEIPDRPKDAKPSRISDWAVSEDDVLYVVRAGHRLQRFEDGRWTDLPKPGGRLNELHVGPEGTVWVEREDGRTWNAGGGTIALRLDGEEWTPFELGPRQLYPSPEAIAADGAFWVAPSGDLMTNGGCVGLVRVGDTDLQRFLPDMCVYDIAVRPNGEVWVEAGSWEGNWYLPEKVGAVNLYAITPEAWTAGT